jgi:hypothetical protein
VNCAKRGKVCSRVTTGVGLVPDWLTKRRVCSDWLMYFSNAFLTNQRNAAKETQSKHIISSDKRLIGTESQTGLMGK